jgi:HK97 family phage major capsid protein
MSTKNETETKTADQEILDHLRDMSPRLKKIDGLEKSIADQKAGYDSVTKILDEVKAANDALRKQMLGIGRRRELRNGEVSDDCARWLGGLALRAGIEQGRFQGKTLDMAQAEVKNIFGAETRASLTSSNIPMPTEFAPEVVELVFQYGDARKLCTVFPMGTLTLKLPKLTTDATFGLVGQSATVTEVSPTIQFVTFTAEKFGGMIRLPSELEEDSIIPIGAFIARYAARNIARIEDTQAFLSTGADSGVNGAGLGLITQVNASNDNCLVIQSTGNTAFSNATLANFRAMRGTSGISGVVLKNARYYLHPTYESQLVTFNTSATVTPYLRATPGGKATLDGFPIEWVSVMPALSSTASVSTVHALFGDATFQYFAPRAGVRFDISREAAFLTDEIMIRALERMTVGYMATKAMAGLQTSAS